MMLQENTKSYLDSTPLVSLDTATIMTVHKSITNLLRCLVYVWVIESVLENRVDLRDRQSF